LRAAKPVPVKANCTVLVPAVAPAQPFAERTVYNSPAPPTAFSAVVNVCGAVGVTTTPAGAAPKVTAKPPTPTVPANFTDTVTAAPGPVAVLQFNVIGDAGVNVSVWACRPLVELSVRATRKHKAESRLRQPSTFIL